MSSASPIRILDVRLGSRCAVCGTDVDPKLAVRCSRCDLPLHLECRSFVGGCPTYGCGRNSPVAGPGAGHRLSGSSDSPLGHTPETGERRHPWGEPAPRTGRDQETPFAAFRFAAMLALTTALWIGRRGSSSFEFLDVFVILSAAGYAFGYASRSAIDTGFDREAAFDGSAWFLRALSEFTVVALGGLVCIPICMGAVGLAVTLGVEIPLGLLYCCWAPYRLGHDLAWG